MSENSFSKNPKEKKRKTLDSDSKFIKGFSSYKKDLDPMISQMPEGHGVQENCRIVLFKEDLEGENFEASWMGSHFEMDQNKKEEEPPETKGEALPIKQENSIEGKKNEKVDFKRLLSAIESLRFSFPKVSLIVRNLEREDELLRRQVDSLFNPNEKFKSFEGSSFDKSFSEPDNNEESFLTLSNHQNEESGFSSKTKKTKGRPQKPNNDSFCLTKSKKEKSFWKTGNHPKAQEEKDYNHETKGSYLGRREGNLRESKNQMSVFFREQKRLKRV